MSATDTVFAGSIPALYDRYLGPVIFTPYARDLAARLSDLREGRVLETAAGTGRVTRELARSLPGEVAIVGTDLNQAMLDFAASQTGSARVSWRQADALALPFEDASFDAVVCQFGAMFFPDKTAGFREARRVLKPGGRFLFNVWGAIEANEGAYVATQILRDLFPDDPPLFLARTPHGHHDIAAISRDLRDAGFRNISEATVDLATPPTAPNDIAVGFCQGTPLRGEIEARRPGGLEAVTEEVAAGIAQRLGAGPMAGPTAGPIAGPIESKMRAHVITAVA